jgi:spermidine synthase
MMIPRLLIDTAAMPDGEDEVRLFQRGDEFSIMLGSNELMNSRMSGSEEALASLAFQAVGDKRNAKLLIGGLGMGFTLRAALKEAQNDTQIVVSELVPAVVDWALGPMSHIFDGCLDDPRVEIAMEDVGLLIAAGTAQYDAILLDVDNGPDALTRDANDRIYSAAGLRAARNNLKPGGVLAVWSSAPDKKFAGRLKNAGFLVEEVVVRANAGRSGARHIIWLATR